jgi:hypothetical protein
MRRTAKGKVAAFGRLFALIWACIAAGASTAAAQWQVIPDGEGSSQSITLRGQLDGSALFQIWCRGTEHHIALLRPDGGNGALSPRGDDILFQLAIDGIPVWSGPGDPYRHSKGWAGLRYRMVQQARGIAESIAGAKSTVAVVVTDSATGQRSSFMAAADGLQVASQDFLARCFGTRPSMPPIVKQPPSPVTPSTPDAVTPSDDLLRLANWQVKEDASGVTLLGFLDPANMLALTCAKDATLRVITQDGRSEPPRADLLMSLSLSVDGREMLPALTARVVRLSRGFLAFEAKLAENSWAKLLVSMLESKRSLRAAIVDRQSGQVMEWTVANDGLPNAALEQYPRCIVHLFQ